MVFHKCVSRYLEFLNNTLEDRLDAEVPRGEQVEQGEQVEHYPILLGQ